MLEREPRPARTAAQVARQLRAAEGAIGDPATSSRRLAVAGRTQQLAYRVLGVHPEWDDAVLAGTPAALHDVVVDNLASRRLFRSMHPDPGDELPAWRIVEPAPARDLLRYYREGERRFGVGWEYLAAVNLVETAMGRIRGTSTAGAQGPMQFLPSTWAAYGEGDIDDPHDAVLGAARYLAANGFAEPGGEAGALYRYNNSSAYVDGVTLLARVMERRPRAFLGYYHWEVYYLTSRGDVHLPVGYSEPAPVPVEEYLAR